MPRKAKSGEQPCPACKEPCSVDAIICPQCRTSFTQDQIDERKKAESDKNKAGLWGCGGLIVIVLLIGMCSGSKTGPDTSSTVPSEVGASTAAAVSSEIRSKQQIAAPVADEPASNLTGPQKNAVRTAEQYLRMSGFSRAGLISQLSSDAGEGYELADATIAVDSLTVDWNEQAARSAEQYLNMSGFSCNGLIDQLSSGSGEQFSKSEARYGAQQAGAC